MVEKGIGKLNKGVFELIKSKKLLAYERQLEMKEERLKRSKRFQGMTEEEIRRTCDVVTCDLYEGRDGYIGIVVPECPYCGSSHYHGTGQGVRLTHCSAHGFTKGPQNYDLRIDFTKARNKKLKSKYESLIVKQGH